MCAAGVGDIGNVNAPVGAASQMPDKKCIDVAKDSVARLGHFTGTFYVFENPADFQPAEVGGEWQASLAAKTVLSPGFRQLADVVRNPRVLPHKRVCDWLAGVAVPHDCGLTLIGDSNCCQVSGPKTPSRHSFCDHVTCALPDLFHVMFNPSGFGVDLFVFLLSDCTTRPERSNTMNRVLVVP